MHYTSKDLNKWKIEGAPGTSGCIDPCVFKLKDGSWKMWYKDEHNGSYTTSATGTDLNNLKPTGVTEVKNRHHEAPIVFFWKGKYRMITDPTYKEFTGLDCFDSDDASNWTYNNTILNIPGKRLDDNEQGRHADVVVLGEKAFIVYHTAPGKIYVDGKETDEPSQYRRRRSSLEIAELELLNGKIICNRDKYAVQ